MTLDKFTMEASRTATLSMEASSSLNGNNYLYWAYTGQIFTSVRSVPNLTHLKHHKKAVVVLGKRLKDDGSPSDVLVTRMNTACRVYREECGPDDVMMLTGGKPGGVPRSEAEVMRDLALGREPTVGMSGQVDFNGARVDVQFGGIDESKIILEDKARTTVENAWLIRERLRVMGIDKAILVTCDFHMRRASFIFSFIMHHRLKKEDYDGLSLVLAPVLVDRGPLELALNEPLPADFCFVANHPPISREVRENEERFEESLPDEKMEDIIYRVLGGIPETIGDNPSDKLHRSSKSCFIKFAQAVKNDVRAVMKEYDEDKDGKLNLQEILPAEGTSEEHKNSKILRKEFKQADKNSDGCIDLNELPGLLHGVQRAISEGWEAVEPAEKKAKTH